MKRAFVVGSGIAPMVLALLMGSGAASAERLPEQVPSNIRSLSVEEIRGLWDGEGMGLARAAELNGHPGPTHLLEAARAGKIHLYAEQRQAIERIHAAMKARAQALGHQILAQEALLEAGFRRGHFVEADLARQVEDIGRKRAELRLAHLRAHMETVGLLRPEQIEEYYQFRGFPAPSAGHTLGH
ncbi:MAG: hypothetical protein A3G35_11285 [candidate division NC10 bacterium RIFCSPLOWO2_12_FULL_66_18]|nr:MAG: hypothetical protein A3G35_11285 [candidate division NC10 bacterium RIFCSPLOWO2_12_FULL_66_18]